MSSPAIQYCRTKDGVRIAFGESGTGPPLVLLPQPINHLSLMWQARSHQELYEQLAARFRFVQYDGRGSGLSDRGLPDLISTLDFDADLQAVVDGLRLGPSILFAPHISSHVAIRFALQQPERVTALILWQALPQYASGEPALLAAIATQDWERAKVMLAQVFFPGVDLDAALQLVDQSCSVEDFIRLARASEDEPLEDRLSDVRVPVLLVYKARAFKRTSELAQGMAIAIPRSQLVFLDDDGDLYGYPRDCRRLMAHIDRFTASLQVNVNIAQSTDPQRLSLWTDRLQSLTPREREILLLIAKGGTNKQIAAELFLSERTVARHITNLYGKLDIHTKSEATAYAIHQGLA